MRIRLTRTAPSAAALAVLVVVSACSAEREAGSNGGGAPTTETATSPSPSALPPPPSRDAPITSVPSIASARWADSDFGVTLKIAPTAAGRRTDGGRAADAAWQEVLELAADADTPGMWEQFVCHWTWARILEPAKRTWNIEPWRPVVDESRMLAAGCNPGGPEV